MRVKNQSDGNERCTNIYRGKKKQKKIRNLKSKRNVHGLDRKRYLTLEKLFKKVSTVK